MFARKHPRLVAGVILIEASEEQFVSTAENRALQADGVRQLGMAAGILEKGVDIPQLRLPGGPPEQAVGLRASVLRAGQDDLRADDGVTDEFPGGIGKLGNTPLVIVRRGKPDKARSEAWNAAEAEAQSRLAGLSTRSITMVAQNSGHMVPVDEPAAVAEAVRRMLEMIR